MPRARRRGAPRAAAAPPAGIDPRDAAGAPAHGRAGRAAAVLPALLVCGVGLALYANSFSVPFLFDDSFEITNNPAVRSLAPLHEYLLRLRGIPALTFALNYRWSGFDVWPFHLVNVAVHLANAVLVYLLVRHTLTLPRLRPRYGDAAGWLAALVALVFVAHPLQTMAATYIVQRAESLGAFFYLLTVLAFATGAIAATPRGRIARYAAASACALLGVLCKETVATVPATLLVYRLCFLPAAPRPPSRFGRILIPLLLVVPIAYVLFLARRYLIPNEAALDLAHGPRAWLYIPSAGFRAQGVSAWHYFLTQFGVIVWYLRLFFVPAGQCFDYGWPLVDSPWRLDVVLPLVLLLAIVTAAGASYRRYPLATFCLAWVFFTLAPTSSIVPLRDAAFEHRMYLPIIGLAWLVVVGGRDALDALAARIGRRRADVRRIGAGVLVAWIALLGIATVHRNEVLGSTLRLAVDTAEKAPQNWRAQFALGVELAQQHRTDDAIAAFEDSIRLDPHQGAPRVQLGGLYVARRQYDDAERVLVPATALLEESIVAGAYVQLAAVHQARGDVDATMSDLQHAAKLKPEWGPVHRQLAGLFKHRGVWYAAAGEYEKAAALMPQRPELRAEAAVASYKAARVLASANRPADAEIVARKAVQYRPQWPAADRLLAYVLAQLGQWDDAAAALRRAAAADPANAAIADDLRRVQAREPLALPPADAVGGE
jgi:tetratricopeptide (TPR) repeat protein